MIMKEKGISLFLLFAMGSVFWNGCGTSGKNDDKAHQAQTCFNNAVYAETLEDQNLAIDECLLIIQNINTSKTYALRCAAIYIKQGILATPNDAAKAYKSGGSQQVLLGRLAFQDEEGKTRKELVDEADLFCEKSTVESYVTLARSSKFATLLLGGDIFIDTENDSEEEIKRKVDQALGEFQSANPERKNELAEVAKKLHQNDCKSAAQQSSSLCKQLDTTFNNLNAEATNEEIADAISRRITQKDGAANTDDTVIEP